MPSPERIALSSPAAAGTATWDVAGEDTRPARSGVASACALTAVAILVGACAGLLAHGTIGLAHDAARDDRVDPDD